MNIKESRDIKLLAELNREIQDLNYKMYPDKYKPFKLEKLYRIL